MCQGHFDVQKLGVHEVTLKSHLCYQFEAYGLILVIAKKMYLSLTGCLVHVKFFKDKLFHSHQCSDYTEVVTVLVHLQENVKL